MKYLKYILIAFTFCLLVSCGRYAPMNIATVIGGKYAPINTAEATNAIVERGFYKYTFVHKPLEVTLIKESFLDGYAVYYIQSYDDVKAVVLIDTVGKYKIGDKLDFIVVDDKN